MNEITVVSGKQIALSTFEGALNAKDRLVGARKFCADKFGVTLNKGDKMPDVKAAAIAGGITEEQFKLARKEYDKQSNLYFSQSRTITALYASDPNYRQSVRRTKTGAVTTFRKVTASAAKVGANARIAQLEALLAAAGITAPGAQPVLTA